MRCFQLHRAAPPSSSSLTTRCCSSSINVSGQHICAADEKRRSICFLPTAPPSLRLWLFINLVLDSQLLWIQTQGLAWLLGVMECTASGTSIVALFCNAAILLATFSVNPVAKSLYFQFELFVSSNWGFLVFLQARCLANSQMQI